MGEQLERLVWTAVIQGDAIVELDRLLEHLVCAWQVATDAACVLIAVRSEWGPFHRIAAAYGNEHVALYESRLPDSAASDDDLYDVLSRITGSDVAFRSGNTMRRTLGTPADVSFGMLIVVGGDPLPDEADRRLREATSALLNRALSQDRLLRDAKLESLAEFAAGAGHEINNPLAAISGRVQLLLRGEQDPERRRHLATIGAQALRIRDMIGDVMLFARPPLPQPQVLNLAEVFRSVVSKFDESCAVRQLTLRCDCASEVRVWADETQLDVVLSQLIRNAVEASPQGSTIRMVASFKGASAGEWTQIIISDEGTGLAKEAAIHAFDPFYSGRQAGRGLGFGLSKCWRIVTNHGGSMELANQPDRGLTVLIRWPAMEQPHETLE
ncbi:MAG: HAMP domain-containing histidine kinase [Planctomycetaceae bacterium]|nr:HAMP domain-containing histidine kinase [Planctomycetaceae bacterium]